MTDYEKLLEKIADSEERTRDLLNSLLLVQTERIERLEEQVDRLEEKIKNMNPKHRSIHS